MPDDQQCALCHSLAVVVYRLLILGSDGVLSLCADHDAWFEDYHRGDDHVTVVDRMPACPRRGAPEAHQ